MARLTTELRKKVMRGAGWKCERCGTRINSLTGEIHHKNGNHNDNRISNLEALCKDCHKKITEKQRKSPAMKAKRQAAADRRFWWGK